MAAAKWGSTDVVEFLLSTSRISSEVVDAVLKEAAGLMLYPTETVTFLCSKKLAPSDAVNGAFRVTSHFAALHQNE
ncbi:hypothetical protein GN244_ATG13674 [Phytophthora infestans]|uniref:Uncharacterized protein n=1 Tax=Phytophthora infestans TaxID=4787 RepID=A0A833RP43_PHYIN|nr:hypothetical protein GN244_ATG18868 [Phytophthora infestans]KAF4034371.1 hypothetical protein GN244_ATG13674 [Phytophthora infestans]KAF4147046.1 hypothetical protein GN958_ATG03766 [Phytophthora infestans]